MQLRYSVGWESGPKALSSVALHYAYVRCLIFSMAFTEEYVLVQTLPPVIIAAVVRLQYTPGLTLLSIYDINADRSTVDLD